MLNLRSFIRAILPQGIRERIYHARLYIRNFGVMQGLIAYYKLSKTKRGIVRISIPQSKTKIALRANTSDLKAFDHIFLFDNMIYGTYINIMPKVIVDAGANAGYASVYFANKYPEAQIIALEPEASNFDILNENTFSYPNVMRLRSAVRNKKTILNIENPEDEKWAFRVQESASGDSSIEAITMEEIIKLSNNGFIDILKLDIEGAEKEVFSNGQNWLDKVGILIVELHDKIKPGCSQSFYSAVSKFSFTEFCNGERIILVKDLQQNDVHVR